MSITVGIPTYNAEKFLKSCLDSVFSQTVKPSEVLVVDNASTDKTTTIASKYDVRLIKKSENLGIGDSRKKIVDYAKGEYVAFLSADDMWEPTFLEDSMKYLDDETIRAVRAAAPGAIFVG